MEESKSLIEPHSGLPSIDNKLFDTQNLEIRPTQIDFKHRSTTTRQPTVFKALSCIILLEIDLAK
jgi:hypothetical protein